MQGIGEILKKTREAQGITLEEVSQATKIRCKYLEAIEQEEFQLLPGEIYAKGFVTTYLKYLGIKEKPEVVAIMQAKPKAAEPPAHIGDEQEKEKQSQAGRRTAQQKQYTSRSTRRKMPPASFEEKPLSKKGSLIIILSIVAIVLLLGLQWAYTRSMEETPPNTVQQQENVQNSAQQQNAGEPGTDGTTAAPDGTPSDVQEPVTPSEPVQPTYQGLEMKLEILNLDANAVDQCWMEITVDGKKSQMTLSEGQIQEVQAEESIKLNLGNAGAVKVTINGEDLGTLGQKGQVVKKSFRLEDFVTDAQ